MAFTFVLQQRKVNPMTVAMGEAFEEAIAQLSDDKDLRCLILTGKGKHLVLVVTSSSYAIVPPIHLTITQK